MVGMKSIVCLHMGEVERAEVGEAQKEGIEHGGQLVEEES